MTDGDAADNEQPNPPLVPRRFEVDPRKFSHYVLDPAKAKGKDAIFVGRLGYRVRNEESARILVAEYLTQARTLFARGAYAPRYKDQYGGRYAVTITLRGVRLRSVWLLRSDGVCALVTPFSGFERPAPQGEPSP